MSDLTEMVSWLDRNDAHEFRVYGIPGSFASYQNFVPEVRTRSLLELPGIKWNGNF